MTMKMGDISPRARAHLLVASAASSSFAFSLSRLSHSYSSPNKKNNIIKKGFRVWNIYDEDEQRDLSREIEAFFFLRARVF